jgi:hypothetical protein
MHIVQGRAIIGRWRHVSMRRVLKRLKEEYGDVIRQDDNGNWSIRGSTLRGRWRTYNQGGEK